MRRTAQRVASSLPPLSQRVGAGVAPKLPPHKRPVLSVENNLLLRERHLSPSLKAHYAKAPAGPLKLQHGSGQFLYDEAGEEYLDLVNNVCHVGHCHPRVVAAASVQLGKLNTNSRYLHDNIVRLSQELTATMPDALTTCFFVNSGSEANDLALRLARNHTARQDVYCVDGAYHGNSTATLAISPYSRYAPVEKPEGVVKLLQPDAYRLGLSGAATTGRALDEYDALLRSGRHPPAAYIVESIQSCGGQVFLPDGYLRGMFELTRAHGGVNISDEVQTGFGRVGHSFWAFERHGAVPDIVTIGKPFGNGFPLAAVVTSSAIAETSAECEYFNTFGGNPVATAVGLEVLSVIEDERLMENAREVGGYALQALNRLMREHEVIGDVRGEGLMFGVEFVTDRGMRTPDPDAAAHAMAHMRANGVLVSVDGPHASVIKMKPPMCVNVGDMDRLVNALDSALREYRYTSTSAVNGTVNGTHPHATHTHRDAPTSHALPAAGAHTHAAHQQGKVREASARAAAVLNLDVQHQTKAADGTTSTHSYAAHQKRKVREASARAAAVLNLDQTKVARAVQYQDAIQDSAPTHAEHQQRKVREASARAAAVLNLKRGSK